MKMQNRVCRDMQKSAANDSVSPALAHVRDIFLFGGGEDQNNNPVTTKAKAKTTSPWLRQGAKPRVPFAKVPRPAHLRRVATSRAVLPATAPAPPSRSPRQPSRAANLPVQGQRPVVALPPLSLLSLIASVPFPAPPAVSKFLLTAFILSNYMYIQLLLPSLALC